MISVKGSQNFIFLSVLNWKSTPFLIKVFVVKTLLLHFLDPGLSEGVLHNDPCLWSVCPVVRGVSLNIHNCSLVFPNFLFEVRAQ